MVLRERLVKFDEKTRTLTYGIIDAPNTPVPFVNYESTIKVKETSPRSCSVEWSGAYEPKNGVSPAECREFAHGVYAGGIAGAVGLAKKKK